MLLKTLELIKIMKFEVEIASYDLIVHIGAPKTGSSAIQSKFTHYAKELQRQGIYYPSHLTDMNGISGGHWDLASCLVDNDLGRARSLLAGYLKEARKVNCTLLISAEGFFNFPERLLEIMPTRKFLIVSFLRHPLESFQSSYNQDIKRHFSTSTIREFAKSLACMKPAITGEPLIKWWELLGKEQLHIIPYSVYLSFDSPTILEKLLGLHIEDNEARINRSYTPCALLFKRMLNTVLDKKNASMNHRLDLLLQSYSDSANPASPSLKCLLGEQLYAELDRKYATILNQINLAFDINVEFSDLNIGAGEYESIDTVLDVIKSDKNLFLYIHECIHESAKSNNLSYDLLELISIFKVDINNIFNNRFSLGINELDIVTSPKSEMPDVLREFSKFMEIMGDSESAYRIAIRALELRPTGPYIQALVKRLSDNIISLTKGERN